MRALLRPGSCIKAHLDLNNNVLYLINTIIVYNCCTCNHCVNVFSFPCTSKGFVVFQQTPRLFLFANKRHSTFLLVHSGKKPQGESREAKTSKGKMVAPNQVIVKLLCNIFSYPFVFIENLFPRKFFFLIFINS